MSAAQTTRRAAFPAEIHDHTCLSGCLCRAPELKPYRVPCAVCSAFLINNTGGQLLHQSDSSHTYVTRES